MLECGLIVARFLHYAAGMALFGVALFPLYAYPGRTEIQPSRFGDWLAPVLFKLALATFVSAIFWLAIVIANMAGSFSAAIDPDAVKSVLFETVFGQIWGLRILLAALLVVLTGVSVLRSNHHSLAAPIAVLSGALLATMAGAGHTMHSDGMQRVLHMISDGAHLLAAGAWFGGLLALGCVLMTASDDADLVLQRFSGMGYLAVAILVGSGLINSWYMIGSLANLIATPYGQLLLFKLGIFGAMLCLAGANRFRLVPALSNRSNDAAGPMASLRRNVLAEQSLGIVVILIVSLLGTLEPAIGH